MATPRPSRRRARQAVHGLRRELATPAVSIPDLAPAPARPTLALPATVDVPTSPTLGTTFKVAGVAFTFHGVKVERVGTVRRRKVALWRVVEPARPRRTVAPTIVHLPHDGGPVRVSAILDALGSGRIHA